MIHFYRSRISAKLNDKEQLYFQIYFFLNSEKLMAPTSKKKLYWR